MSKINWKKIKFSEYYCSKCGLKRIDYVRGITNCIYGIQGKRRHLWFKDILDITQ